MPEQTHNQSFSVTDPPIDRDLAMSVIDSFGAGVLVLDKDLNLRFRNKMAATWTDTPESVERLMGKVQVLQPFDGWRQELAGVISTGVARRFEGVVVRESGALPVVLVMHCSALRCAHSDSVEGVVVSMFENADSADLQQRLDITTRLAALGKLAARVAHELNNPLDGILRYINMSLRLIADTPESKLNSYLSESRTGLMRMVQIIGDLLEYSRCTEGTLDAVSVNEVVEDAIRSVTPSAQRNGVVVSSDFQTQSMPVVSGSRLFQVCSNVVKNAIDAMPEGGRMLVSTGVVNDQVVICVSDTGIGLPDDPEKLFEPFYTTKRAGEGTGLGLAICRDYITEMDGTISASPSEEGGAVFTIRIPMASFHAPPKIMNPMPSVSTVDSSPRN